MKKLLFFLLVLIPLFAKSQDFNLSNIAIRGKVERRITSITNIRLEPGVEFEMRGIYQDGSGNLSVHLFHNGEGAFYPLNNIDRVSLNPTNLRDFWVIKAIENDVFANLVNQGYQYDIRKEMEEEAIEYINYLYSNNLLFEDSFLQNYIYSLIHKLYPYRLEDGRPGILNVHITKNKDPNAGIFPNGTMIISTGILSSLNSEEELMAVIAHEIAHFVLDHSILNINKAAQRQRRAEFWAALATGLAAATEVYTAVKYDDYYYGALTTATAGLSYSVAYAITERLGMKFSKEQEMKADAVAAELLDLAGYDKTALSSALGKIREYCILTGNYLALSGGGTHPALMDRILAIALPSDEFYDTEFDKQISFINTYNARVNFFNNQFVACTTLIKRNIDADVATEEDYVLLSMVYLYMYDTEEKNLEALNYVNIAKQLNVYPIIDMYKQEALVLIRLGRLEQAKKSLLRYQEILQQRIDDLARIQNPSEWSIHNRFYRTEYEWSAKMIHKVTRL